MHSHMKDMQICGTYFFIQETNLLDGFLTWKDMQSFTLHKFQIMFSTSMDILNNLVINI